MKLRFVTLLFVIVVGGGMALAQASEQPARRDGGNRTGQRPVLEMRAALADLDLSDDQMAGVREIFRSLPDKLRDLETDTANMEPRQRAQRFRELLDETRQQVSELLSDDQRQKFDEAVREARSRRGDAAGRRNRGADPGAGPSTPADPAPPAERVPRAGPELLQRLERAVESLQLEQSQKHEIDRALAELRSKLQEIRANAAPGVRGAMEQVRQAVQSARQQVGQQLTPEQRRQLRDAMQDPDGDRARPLRGADRPERGQRQQRDGERPRRGGEPNPSDRTGANLDDPMTGEGMAGPDPGAAPPTTQPTTQPTASAVGRFVLVEGSPAPALSTVDLSGRAVPLESLRHRLTVLVFGSYSLPTFREQAIQINRLRNELGTRGQVYVIYTREAHPAGEWEVSRNREDQIAVPQHPSMPERLAAAREAVRRLKLDVPVLVDDMDDSTLSAYGNHPGGAVLLRPDRTVALHQRHFDAHGMRRAIAERR